MITIVTGNGYGSQLMGRGNRELKLGELFKDYQVIDFVKGRMVNLSNNQFNNLQNDDIEKKAVLNFPESMMAERKYFKAINELLDMIEKKDIIIFTYSANFIETIQDMAKLKQVSNQVSYLFIDFVNDRVTKYLGEKGEAIWHEINDEFDEWDDRLDYIKAMILCNEINGDDINYKESIDYIESEGYAEKRKKAKEEARNG